MRFPRHALRALVWMSRKKPFDPADPIFALSNLVIAPHIGAATQKATDRASLHSAIGIHEVLSGKKPSWPVPGF